MSEVEEHRPKKISCKFEEISKEEFDKLSVIGKKQYNRKLKYHTNEEVRKKQNEICRARYAKIKEVLALQEQFNKISLTTKEKKTKCQV